MLLRLQETLDNNAASVNALTSFHNIKKDIGLEEFKKLSKDVLNDHPSIILYAWLPRVEHSDRGKFETTLKEIYSENFQVLSGAGFGNIIVAKPQDTYFPVLYSKPLIGQINRIGLDMSSLPIGGPALRMGITNKTVTASAPINGPEEFGNNTIVMLINPVFEDPYAVPSNPSETDVRGMVGALFEVGTLIEKKITSDLDVTYYLEDITDTAKPMAIYGIAPQNYKGRRDEVISFAGRTWKVTSTTNYTGAGFEWVPPLILIVGILLSAALAFTLASMINRRINLESLVEERTEELSQAVQKLSESNGNLERFAQNCSHDLQTPLRQVGSFADLLKMHMSDKLENDEEGSLFLDKILDGTAFAQKLVADILTYSSIGSGGISKDELDTNTVITLVKENMSIELESIGGTISSDPLPVIYGNKSSIFQLLQNLISNGLKYQSAEVQPKVHVSSKELASHWEFSVKDNGIGIKPEHLGKVFEIFQRLHRKDYAGNGIGLPICQKVVESHGGKIWVESEPGQGSTFFFTLAKTSASAA